MNFRGIILLLFLLGFCVYGNTLFYPFVHDDVVFIQNNPQIGVWDDVGRLFLRPATNSFPCSVANFYYRPILELLYKIQYAIFGFNPLGFHLFNILLHILNAILVYLIVDRLARKQPISLLTALFFLVHPVQSESVSAIVGVSNLLVSFFCLLSFLCYLHREDGGRTRGCRTHGLILSLVFFIGGLLTKEQAVILPFLIILYDFLISFQTRAFFRERLLRPRLFFFVLVSYLFFRHYFGGGFFLWNDELLLRLLSIPGTLLIYMRILIFPNDLHYYRCFDVLSEWGGPAVILGVLAGIFFALIRFFSKENRRLLIFSLLWFLVCLLPVLNILPLINEYSLILTAEHFLYMPLIGFLLFVIIVFHQGMARYKNGFGGAIIFLLVILSVITIRQNTFWRGEIPLFEKAVQHESRFGRLHLLLAKAYYFHREMDKAINEYKKASNIMEEYILKTQGNPAQGVYKDFLKEIHFDLAHCYEAKDEINSSIKEYEKAMEGDPLDVTIYNNLGALYIRGNNAEKAEASFRKALDLQKNNVMALSNLAICHIQKKNFLEAERLLREAIRIDPQFAPARQNLDRLLNQKQ